jgi:hypothetical protein
LPKRDNNGFGNGTDFSDNYPFLSAIRCCVLATKSLLQYVVDPYSH